MLYDLVMAVGMPRLARRLTYEQGGKLGKALLWFVDEWSARYEPGCAVFERRDGLQH